MDQSYNPGQNCWNSIHLFSQIFPHFQQRLTAPSFRPFNVALSEIESQVVTQHCIGGGGGGGKGALDNKNYFNMRRQLILYQNNKIKAKI